MRPEGAGFCPSVPCSGVMSQYVKFPSEPGGHPVQSKGAYIHRVWLVHFSYDPERTINLVGITNLTECGLGSPTVSPDVSGLTYISRNADTIHFSPQAEA